LTTPVAPSIANRPPALSLRLKLTVPPLTSLDAAVIPTRSPFDAPSDTVLAPTSEARRVGDATSVTASAKSWVANAPLASAALTLNVWLVEVSKSGGPSLATLTTPVAPSIANRPPALSLRLKLTVPPLTSLDAAVIPTRSPFDAPSDTVLAP